MKDNEGNAFCDFCGTGKLDSNRIFSSKEKDGVICDVCIKHTHKLLCKSPENDQDEMSAENELIKSVAKQTVRVERQMLSGLERHFKEHSHKSKFEIYDPFILDSDNLDKLNSKILELIKGLDNYRDIPIHFSGAISLKDNREHTFHDFDQLIKWDQPDDSYPVSIIFNWIYTFEPMKDFMPFDYQIKISFTTKPDYEHEEEIKVIIETPNIDMSSKLTPTIRSEVEDLLMDPWWKVLKLIISKTKGYFGTAMYVFFIFLFTTIYTTVSDSNEYKAQFLKRVFSTDDLTIKFDEYIKYVFDNNQLQSHFGQYMLYILISIVISVTLTLIASKLFRMIAPPSFILIGKKGNRRKIIIKIYTWLWAVILSTMIGLTIKVILS